MLLEGVQNVAWHPPTLSMDVPVHKTCVYLLALTLPSHKVTKSMMPNIPPSSSARHCPWFQKNIWILDSSDQRTLFLFSRSISDETKDVGWVSFAFVRTSSKTVSSAWNCTVKCRQMHARSTGYDEKVTANPCWPIRNINKMSWPVPLHWQQLCVCIHVYVCHPDVKEEKQANSTTNKNLSVYSLTQESFWKFWWSFPKCAFSAI